ncbi:MAG: MFS transporter [Actinobacteria bacterium]|uniref:Unannotated protein n=1 Tax=freshwater metagenome TaxID=449393 RepID=A0A6J6UBX6_9ZZZZ|nr:MFS transporter [Actinomycetota bacterium]
MTATASAEGAGNPDVSDSEAEALAAPKAAIFFLGALGGTQAVDPIIASTALVKASRGLAMQGGMIALAASISTVVLAATVISMGLLGDRIGWRRLLIGSLIVSMVGDLLAAAAPASAPYLAGRALAGLGLGGVFAASFAYVRIITPREKVPAALGLYSASGSMVLVTLSLLGGALASIEWRAAFLIVPVACALYVLLATVLLPATGRQTGGPTDLLGQVLLALGIVGVLLGLSHMSQGVRDALFWVPTLAGVALLGAFVMAEQRAESPFFPVAVLRNPLFLGAMAAGFVYNFTQSSTVLQFSNLWQYVSGLSPMKVSAGTLPFLLVGILAALMTGRLITNGLRNSTVILIGGLLCALGGFATLLHHPESGYLALLPALLLLGFGATMASIPYGGLIVQAASGKFSSFYGPVTSSRTTIGQIAYAMGLALSTVMVDKLTTGGVVTRLREAGVSPSRTASALDSLGIYVRSGKDPVSRLAEQTLSLAKESYVNSFQTTMVAVGLLALVAALFGATVLRRGAAVEAAADEPDASTTEWARE